MIHKSSLTLFETEAGGPLLQGDVFVVVGITRLKEAIGAVLHGNEGSTEGGKLWVGQVSDENPKRSQDKSMR